MARAPKMREELEAAVKAVNAEGGSIIRASRVLGIPHSTLANRIHAAARIGLTPEPRKTVRATSTLIDAEGKTILQWIKADHKQELIQLAMKAFIEECKAEIAGVVKPVKKPRGKIMELMSAILMGDAHFGMRAFAQETMSADFDLTIASRELRAAVMYLIDSAPPSRYGMLVDVGDFMHVDNRKAMTPNGGNLLDVDTRYFHLCKEVIATFRFCINEMLKKFENVIVVIRPGNHNQDSAGWMSIGLSLAYENEPRVTIDLTQSEYYYHRYGKNLIGVTHGDKCKFADLISIMSEDRPDDWGKTEHRYFWTGHVHHTKQLEFRGGFAESFNTLAPGDAWHSAKGYRSKRQMQRIDMHPDNGIMTRGFCNLGMLDLD